MSLSGFLGNTQTCSGLHPVYLGAFSQGELAGFNAFIPHRFFQNGREIIAYQSCWTATDPAHRGKGVFSSIIEKAKVVLKEDFGAKFILGFPNGNSHPIFVKNLRFKDYPLDKLIIGRFPFWEKYYLRSDQPLTDNGGLYADEQEIYEWKSREHPGQVHRAVVGDSFAWGMVRGKTIRGIRLDFLEVGGISLARAEDLPKLMQGLFSSSKTWFLHVQMHETHPYHHFFKWSEKGHTLIIYDLDHFFDEKNSFGMMPGIKDTY
jgi:hypothetical protein